MKLSCYKEATDLYQKMSKNEFYKNIDYITLSIMICFDFALLVPRKLRIDGLVFEMDESGSLV